MSGDPYLSLGIQAGSIPKNATKDHPKRVFLKLFVCSCSMDQARRRLLIDCVALMKKQIFLFQCTNAYFLSSGSGQMML